MYGWNCFPKQLIDKIETHKKKIISVAHHSEDFYELYAQSVYHYLFSLIGEGILQKN